jgi:diguanylate cyclase (GGDEF)-like protein/PAS domain S-box-containing protein
MPVNFSWKPPRRHGLEWGLLGSVLLIIGALITYGFARDIQHIKAFEADHLQAQARVVDDIFIQQIEGINSALEGVRDELSADWRTSAGGAAASMRLKVMTDAMPGMRALLILNQKGDIVAANRSEFIGQNFAEREYFTTPRRNPDPDVLYVSQPFMSASGVYVINVTRVLTSPQGQFAGVVTAGLDREYFNVVLRSVLYAPDMRATVVHGDGRVFWNMPSNPSAWGLDIAKPGSFFTRHRQAGQKASVLTGRVLATGEDRMVATRDVQSRRVRTDKPLVVHLSRELGALYLPWRKSVANWGAVFALLSVAAAVALHASQRRRRWAEQVMSATLKARDDVARRVRTVTDHIPAFIGYFDAAQRCEYLNEPAQRWLGIDADKVGGYTLEAALGPELYQQHAPYLRDLLAGRPGSFEWVGVRSGRTYDFQTHLIPDQADDGAVRGFYVMSCDVTALKQAERERAAGERRIKTITDNLPVLISYIDREERLQFCNATFQEWLGLDPDTAVGRPFADVVGMTLYMQRSAFLKRALAGERVSFEVESAGASGIARHLQTVYVPDVQPDGTVAGLYGLSTDVTPLKLIERHLNEQARRDPLTLLPNRRLFDERLSEALARSRRDARGMALMVLDLDRFKDINDTYGHGTGDAVLKEFAHRLLDCVRTTDTVARLAGDEFVIILEGLRERDEAQQIAEKIGEALRPTFHFDQCTMQVTSSVGVAYLDGENISAEEVIAKADAELYKAKQAGRNTFAITSC